MYVIDRETQFTRGSVWQEWKQDDSLLNDNLRESPKKQCSHSFISFFATDCKYLCQPAGCLEVEHAACDILKLWVITLNCLRGGNLSPNHRGLSWTDCNHSDWWRFANNCCLICKCRQRSTCCTQSESVCANKRNSSTSRLFAKEDSTGFLLLILHQSKVAVKLLSCSNYVTVSDLWVSLCTLTTLPPDFLSADLSCVLL